MLQDIRYPYLGDPDAESLHKFSERIFDRLTKDNNECSTADGRKFIFTLDPLQDQSTQQDMIIRTDVFHSLVTGGREIVLPRSGETIVLVGKICPTFKIHKKREFPILDWFNSRQLIQESGVIEELQYQTTIRRDRYPGRRGGWIPETTAYLKFKVTNVPCFYTLLRRGIGDNRSYGLGFLLHIQ